MNGLGTFGRYLLIEELAAGGMGQVYRAMLRGGPGFEKEVALKRVLRELGEDGEFVARFGDEARIASTLSHGNIVQVFDFGEHEGEFYLAMEFVDGPNLGSLLQAARDAQQPIPRPAALYIAAELCRGLAAAHQRRDARGAPAPVVHRDVSPQNVLVSRLGEVKVTDFGIAKAAEKALRTQTGMLMGKVRYMAPEQARAEAVDARADVFAAGCVLFELVAGRPLFEGPTPESVLLAVLQAPIPRISEVAPNVPAGLDAILERALDRDRAQRYLDGAAFARDLERLLHVIAPAFSRDDLAALVRALVPPLLRVEQMPTREVGTRAALVALAAHPTVQDTPSGRDHEGAVLGAAGADHAPRPPDEAPDEAPATPAATPAAPQQALDPVDSDPEPEVELALFERPLTQASPLIQASPSTQASPSGRSAPGEATLAGTATERPRQHPLRALALLALAALLGGGSAAIAARVWPRPHEVVVGALRVNSTVTLGDERITLREVGRRGAGATRRLLLVLELPARSGDATQQQASWFVLGRDRERASERALFWQRRGRRLRLGFAWPRGDGPLRLGLSAPGRPTTWARLEL